MLALYDAGKLAGVSPTAKKVLLDEMALSANTWYRYRVVYSKTGCNVYPNEVNYSFSTTTSWSDDWLGKIYIDSTCNRTFPSDPPGMIN